MVFLMKESNDIEHLNILTYQPLKHRMFLYHFFVSIKLIYQYATVF